MQSGRTASLETPLMKSVWAADGGVWMKVPMSRVDLSKSTYHMTYCYEVVMSNFFCCGSLKSDQLLSQELFPHCLKVKRVTYLPHFVTFYNQQAILGIYSS